MSSQTVDIILNARAVTQEAFDKVGESLKSVGKSVNDFTNNARQAFNAFGGPQAVAIAETAGRIADLTESSKLSAEALQRYGFAAEQNGASMEVLAKGTNTMVRNLETGKKATQAALDDLGLSANALKAMKPEDAFLAISDALRKMPDEYQQAQAAQALFGGSGRTLLPTLVSDIRAVGAGATVMSNETVKALDDAGDAFDAMQSNMKAKAGEVLGSITQLVGSDTVAIGGMLATVGAQIGPMITAMAALWPVIATVASTISGALVGALGLLLSPIGLVVAAVVGLGLVWYKWGDDIKAAVSKAYEVVKEYLWDKFGPIVQAVSGFLSTMKGYWDTFKGGVTTVVTETAATTKSFLVDKFEDVKSGVSTGLSFVKSLWDAHNTAVGTLLGLLIGKIREHFGPMLSTIAQNVRNVIEPIVTFFTSVKDRAIALAQALWTGVKQWLVDRFTDIVGGVKEKIDAVSGFFKDLYDKVVGHSFIPDLINGIGNWMGRLPDVMVRPAQEAASDVAKAFNDLNENTSLQTLGTNFAKVLDDMRIEAGGWKDRVLDIWSEFRDGVRDRIKNISDTFADSIVGMLNGTMTLKEGLTNIWNDIKEAIVKTVLDMIANMLTEYIRGIGIIRNPPGIPTPTQPPTQPPGTTPPGQTPPGQGDSRSGFSPVFPGFAGGRSFASASFAGMPSGGVPVASASRAPIVIINQTYLNRRQIAESVYEELPGVMQRRGHRF